MTRCHSRLDGRRCDHEQGHGGDHRHEVVSSWIGDVADKRLKIATPTGRKFVEDATHDELVNAMYSLSDRKSGLGWP